jgi:hypothetical protein
MKSVGGGSKHAASRVLILLLFLDNLAEDASVNT